MFSHTYTGAQCCKHTAWMKCQADTEQKLLLAVLKIHTTGSECGWTNDRYIILNKIPFLPQKHVFHGCLEKGQIAGYEYWLYKLREIGLLENRRLTQWLNDRKETAKEKMCKTKKKNKALSARSSIILYHTGPHKALSVDHQTPFTSQRLFRLLVYPGSNTCRISSHSTFVTSICFT